MQYMFTLAATVALSLAGTGAALAGSDIYTGDGTSMAGELLMHPYKAKNNCPAGLQQVTLGGVICCGVPNTKEYYVNRSGGGSRGSSRALQPYAPEGVKGVVYR